MSEAKTAKPVSHPEMTTRKDNWWLEPLLIATGFTAFIIYATYRVFENGLYEYNQYLSPFYSPHFEFEWWHFSPAILILWIPARIPRHLLLLPESLLPLLFPHPSSLCGRHARTGQIYR